MIHPLIEIEGRLAAAGRAVAGHLQLLPSEDDTLAGLAAAGDSGEQVAGHCPPWFRGHLVDILLNPRLEIAARRTSVSRIGVGAKALGGDLWDGQF